MNKLVGGREDKKKAQTQRRKQVLEPPFTRVIYKSLWAGSVDLTAYARAVKGKSCNVEGCIIDNCTKLGAP